MDDNFTYRPGKIGGGNKVHYVLAFPTGRVGQSCCGLDTNTKGTGRRRAYNTLVDAPVNCQHCLRVQQRAEQEKKNLDIELATRAPGVELTSNERYIIKRYHEFFPVS